MNPESITAGKATLHRNHYGTVWFIDKNGNKRSFDGTDHDTAVHLYEAIKDGSGEPVATKITAGTESTARQGVLMYDEIKRGWTDCSFAPDWTR